MDFVMVRSCPVAFNWEENKNKNWEEERGRGANIFFQTSISIAELWRILIK
jgi:hypothetical protein